MDQQSDASAGVSIAPSAHVPPEFTRHAHDALSIEIRAARDAKTAQVLARADDLAALAQ